MFRTILLVLVFSASVSVLPAQDTVQGAAPKKGSRMTIDFSGSYSLALGKYAAKDKEQESSGFASGGFVAQFKVNWLGRKDFGLGISYAYQQNALQKEASDVVIPGGDTNGLGTRSWSNHYLLAGPVMVKEFNRWTVDAALLVGFVVAGSPNFTMLVPVDSVHTSVSSGAGTGFAYQFRVAAGYRVSNRIILTAGFSFLGGSPTRKKENYVYAVVEDPPGSGNFIPTNQGYTEVRKKKISTFNPGIGMIIKL